MELVCAVVAACQFHGFGDEKTMVASKTNAPAGKAGLMTRIGAFWNDRRGNVAMMFGLAAIPFFAFGGLAVDYSRAMMVKNRLSSALDATALAVAGQTGQTEAQLRASADAYFQANYPDSELGTTSALQITFGDREIAISATATVETLIMGLIGYHTMTVEAEAEVKKSSNSLEVAMVLDVTGSMGGTRIADLRAAATDLVNTVIWDDQTQYTSKVALVPYSMGVNVGSYAEDVRGPVTPGKSISNAAWFTGSIKTMTSATKANPMVVTSNAHGFAEGDTVYVSSVVGWPSLNNKVYTINYVDANRFRLRQGGTLVSSSGYSGSYTASSGRIRKCLVSDCGVVVTSNNHGFSNGDRVVISGVSGMTQINNAANTTWTVANRTVNTFSLAGTATTSYGTYTSGGNIFCTVAGCEYLAFTNMEGNQRVHQISTCVTERTGGEAYTDAAPSTAFVGRNYPGSSNPCLTNTIVPLTSDKDLLNGRISTFVAAGSTAGQIGTAWGWYMISPNFASLWPSASQPQPYDTDELIKIAILMTDGAYNTPYCQGVIAQNAGSGSGSNSEKINCNATNGNPYTQAETVCEAMKDEGIIIYTVAFDLAGNEDATDMMANCATNSSHAFTASNGTALRDAFRAIAVDISNLRLSR